jgi:ATP-dependent DNA helicase RecG
MAHPDVFADAPDARRLVPRYVVPGVKNATLRTATQAAMTGLPDVPDPVPAAIAARNEMPDARALHAALARVHGVGSHAAAPIVSPEDVRIARERLAWAEAFVRVWQRLSSKEQKTKATPLPKSRAARTRVVAELGFGLTEGQKRAFAEIEADLARDVPMRRLLTGDVGTGKTAVAMLAVAQCVTAKKQAAMLSPTGILAEQTMDAIAPLARATGARIALVVGKMKEQHKARLRAEIAAGKIDLVVGTHALLSQDFAFKDLALVVVDEQQRLGVAQRLALVRKGKRPHLLSLSATPIPRTLALALLGDVAESKIDERPRGRPPVTTEITSTARFDDVLTRVRAASDRGERTFVIAPRVAPTDDGEEEDDANGVPLAAEALAPFLSKKLRRETALVHGSLSFEEKRQIMTSFRKGDASVLVGTTVLEVGVDVPEATLMVVVGAERFGLSQLHQLRGRVGRGSVPGTCVLVHGPEVTPVGRERLDALARFEKGIDVARADLELRGAGDLSGTAQSGDHDDFMYLDPLAEPPWLSTIASDAERVFARDPSLAHEDHRGLALLRGRFERILAIREDAG